MFGLWAGGFRLKALFRALAFGGWRVKVSSSTAPSRWEAPGRFLESSDFCEDAKGMLSLMMTIGEANGV